MFPRWHFQYNISATVQGKSQGLIFCEESCSNAQGIFVNHNAVNVSPTCATVDWFTLLTLQPCSKSSERALNYLSSARIIRDKVNSYTHSTRSERNAQSVSWKAVALGQSSTFLPLILDQAYSESSPLKNLNMYNHVIDSGRPNISVFCTVWSNQSSIQK